MNIVKLLLIFLGSSTLFAAPSITSFSTTGSVLFCDSSIYVQESYDLIVKQANSVKLKIENTPTDSPIYTKLTALLSILKEQEGQAKVDAEKFDKKIMAAANVTIDSERTLPLSKLGGLVGQGKIEIVNAKISENIVTVPKQTVEIRFFGANFCKSLLKNDNDGYKAAVALIDELFSVN